jgi:peptide/nickel transport system substrate-binding protein
VRLRPVRRKLSLAASLALALAVPSSIAVAFAGALSGCAQSARGRIVVAAAEIPSRLDPVRASSPAEENACELVFDGLVDIAANDSGTASPVLGLAESIVQDASDRALYRITLREAKWHDGRALDSRDVEASFAAYTDPANRSPRRDYLLGLVASIGADGERSVLVRFREPIAEFRAWYVLAFKIVPREFRGQAFPSDRSGSAGEAFAAAPIGTGPFRFQSRRSGEIVFAANKDCYRGAPASELFVLRRVASSEERIQALLQGKVDVIADTSPLDRPKLERAGDVLVQSYMPHAFYAAALNLRERALAKLDARVAIVRAVDRASLVPGLTDRSSGVELNRGPFPDGLLTKVLPEYFHQGFPDHLAYDKRLASSFAGSSGLASATGDDSKLKIATPASWGEFGSRLAAALAAQLGDSLIGAVPSILPDEDYKAALESRNFDIALVYHEGYDNLFSGISDLYRSGSPLNETGVSSPDLDKLLASRDGAVEATAWLSDTLALHDLVSSLAPYVPLFTLEKDLFYRGVSGLLIASDNPYLTAERWSIAKP